MGLADELPRLRELSDAATPGPWIRRWQALDVHHMTGDDALTAQRDIDFAVAACAFVRDLLEQHVGSILFLPVHPFTCGTCDWEGPDRDGYFAHCLSARHDNWRALVPA